MLNNENIDKHLESSVKLSCELREDVTATPPLPNQDSL